MVLQLEVLEEMGDKLSLTLKMEDLTNFFVILHNCSVIEINILNYQNNKFYVFCQ